MNRGAWVDRRWAFAAAVLVVVKLWFVAAQPVVAIGPAGHDDRLFLQLADSILQGDWLGGYTRMTLVKGPGYSVFAAATVAAGVPLPLAQHLLYIAACWLAVRAVRPWLGGDVAAFAVFAALVVQPMSFESPVLGRPLRQHLYTPAALVVFASIAAVLTRTVPGRRAVWAAVGGLALGVMHVTREETVWIAAPVAVGLAALVRQAWRSRVWREPALLAGLAACAASAPVLTVCALNRAHYGWFGTVEFRAPEFRDAYGAILRVQAGDALAGVPVNRASRLALYELSPAFAELRPHLEGEVGENWTRASAFVHGLPPERLEIAGGWWMWALRDAAAAAGHAASPRALLDYFARLAAEVNAACDAGQVPALAPRSGFVPPWRPEFTAGLLREAPGYAWYFVSFRDAHARSPASLGDPAVLQLFRDITQWHLAPSADAAVLATPRASGWRAWRVEALQRLADVVRWPLCLALLAGVAAGAWWGCVAVVRRAWPGDAWAFALACAGGAGATVAINLLVHVTSFPNLSPGALAQAYPVAILGAAVAIIPAVRWATGRPTD